MYVGSSSGEDGARPRVSSDGWNGGDWSKLKVTGAYIDVE